MNCAYRWAAAATRALSARGSGFMVRTVSRDFVFRDDAPPGASQSSVDREEVRVEVVERQAARGHRKAAVLYAIRVFVVVRQQVSGW